MTIGRLKTLIASYLQKLDPVAFLKGVGESQVDLLLTALNNARKIAEREHDFAVCLRGGYYTVGPMGANWANDITWWESSNVKVRAVQNWYLRGPDGVGGGEYGNDTILRATDKATLVKAQAALSYSHAHVQHDCYSSCGHLSSSDPLLGQTYIIIHGQKFSLHPKPSTDRIVTVDACFWWPDWTLDSEDDWFTQNGSDYLMHQGIIEANRLVSLFVGNTEGNLPPPTKEAERALTQLIASDEDSTDQSQFLEPL